MGRHPARGGVNLSRIHYDPFLYGDTGNDYGGSGGGLASPFQIFVRLGIPLGASGILSAVVLGFLEYWNAMEAPQAFLKNQALWPLSLYMANITADNAGVSLIASLITLMPPLLIFLAGQKYLEQGIISSGMKD